MTERATRGAGDSAGTARRGSSPRACGASALLLGLAIAASPALLGRFVDLDWRVGDMRPVLHE